MSMIATAVPTRRSETPTAVVLIGLAGLAVAMGIGRFAFTPLLPLMQRDAGLSLADGSWLATANYVGYLAGAVVCIVAPPDASTLISLRTLITLRSAL